MGGSHSAVEKTFKKNQEYISEMNKNKVVFIDLLRVDDKKSIIVIITFLDGAMDSDAISDKAKRESNGNSKKS